MTARALLYAWMVVQTVALVAQVVAAVRVPEPSGFQLVGVFAATLVWGWVAFLISEERRRP